MKTETCKHDSRLSLTVLESELYCSNVIRFEDIESALGQQVKADVTQLKAIYAEQAKLRPAVMRFRDLEAEAQAKELRMRRAMVLLGDDKYPDLKGYGSKPGAIVLPAEGIDELPLWEAIVAILEQKSPIQIIELQHVLEQFQKKVSRQAIESALTTHKDIFETQTQNRDKYVSLKR